MATVIIVRHGNTFERGEAPRRVGSRTDLPLTAEGEAQARSVGRHFAEAGITFDRVLTGPLVRTRRTAALIGETIGSVGPAEVVPWLDEIDHGPDEDRPEADVVARLSADVLAAWDRAAIVPPGWNVDIPGRIAAWRAFLEAAEGTNLIVTSNGAARFALLAAGVVPSLNRLKLRTGAWGRLAGGGRAWTILEWDRRASDDPAG
ncbi:histidine phosphatase family protein [Sphingomonas naphthae]|uniref:Histidine phosphatase family protein n=1 Tax=Sphingomonas naphthae TaxID=1813468 RepID=A0ABY7TPM9_9SPHN|nr:histidine phosphatase family protein [Sphingomonas naphthae]WCT75197.1 histidine phosphatase family protein [Sphingomonas naphthae]